MRPVPEIGKIGEPSDFHDSSLVSFQYLPTDDVAVVVLSTPTDRGAQELWQVRLSGVLAMQLETLGSGERPLRRTPVEIYDVYDDPSAAEAMRWNERLAQLGIKNAGVRVVTFASSFLRGWRDKAELEGLRIVCRSVTVEPAPALQRSLRGSQSEFQSGGYD